MRQRRDGGESEGEPAAGGETRRRPRAPGHAALRHVVMSGLSLLPLIASPLAAQRTTYTNWNAWFVLSGEVAVSDRWSVLFDVSDRRSGPLSQTQAIFARMGANYTLSPHVSMAAGANTAESFPYGKLPGPYKTPERRIWEQLVVTQELGRLSLAHRYRLEQRFLGASSSGDGTIDHWVHAGRLRYQVRGVYPLRGAANAPGSLYAAGSDEVFISYGPTVQNNIFDQNRATLALGYRMSTAWRVELGYLNQLSVKGSGQQVERNHTITLGASFSRPLRR